MASRICLCISALTPSPPAPSSAWLSSQVPRTPVLHSTSWATLEERGYVSIKSYDKCLGDGFSLTHLVQTYLSQSWWPGNGIHWLSGLCYHSVSRHRGRKISLTLIHVNWEWVKGWFFEEFEGDVTRGRKKKMRCSLCTADRSMPYATGPFRHARSFNKYLSRPTSLPGPAVGTEDAVVSNTDSLHLRNLVRELPNKQKNASNDECCEEKKMKSSNSIG